MFTITERNGKYYAKQHKVKTAFEIATFVKFIRDNKTVMVCDTVDDGAFVLCLDPTDVITED